MDHEENAFHDVGMAHKKMDQKVHVENGDQIHGIHEVHGENNVHGENEENLDKYFFL